MPQFKNILVVCIGNICRSPMGEALLRERLSNEYSVSSAGLGALVNHPADPHSVTIMDELGVDITAHRARQINEQILRENDLILVMTKKQQSHLESEFPFARGKVFRMGHWGNLDIEDPYRLEMDNFRKAYDEIDAGVSEWVKRI